MKRPAYFLIASTALWASTAVAQQQANPARGAAHNSSIHSYNLGDVTEQAYFNGYASKSKAGSAPSKFSARAFSRYIGSYPAWSK